MVFPAHTHTHTHTAGLNGSPFPPLSPSSHSKRAGVELLAKKGVRNENENDYMGKLREGQETLKKKRGEMEGSSLAEYFFLSPMGERNVGNGLALIDNRARKEGDYTAGKHAQGIF